MSHRTLRKTLGKNAPRVRKHTVRLWLAVVLVEAHLLLGYFAFTPADPTREIRYLIYPFVWINAGLWAIQHADPNPSNRSQRLLAGALAAGYFLLIMWVPGQIGLGTINPGHFGIGLHHLRIAWYAPGWGPIIAYAGVIRLYLVPFEVIGYGSLAYLMYANVLKVSRGALSGTLGLITCVGCTVPVIAPIVGLLGGPAASLTTTAYAWSYDIGTLVFLLTLGLLYWSLRRNRS